MHQNDSPPANPILPLYNLPSSYTSPDILKNMHFGWTEDSWEIDESPVEDNIDEAGRVELTDKQKYRAHKRKLAREAQAALVAEYKAGRFDA